MQFLHKCIDTYGLAPLVYDENTVKIRL